MIETTALGAAFAAGIGVGFWNVGNLPTCSVSKFVPKMSQEKASKLLKDWDKAISKSLDWERNE
jgi:glycerol kinase